MVFLSSRWWAPALLRGDLPILFRLPEVNFVDDGPGKPAGINEHIGRRLIAAFGRQRLSDAPMDHQGGRHLCLWADCSSTRRRTRICLRPESSVGGWTRLLTRRARTIGLLLP